MKKMLSGMVLAALVAVCGCRTPMLWNAKAGADQQHRFTTQTGGSRTESASDEPERSSSPNTVATSLKPPARETADDLLLKGYRAEEQGNIAEAKRLYQRALDLDSAHTEAHHALAILADRDRDFRLAEQHYKSALRSKPTDANLLSNLGYSYILQQRFDEAEERLRLALQKNPRHTQALANMGLLYGKQNDYYRSLEMFRLAGTEADAQANIRELFPQGPPTQVAATPPANPFAETPERSLLDRLRGKPEEDPNVELRELMAAARQDSLAGRRSRAAADIPAWAQNSGNQALGGHPAMASGPGAVPGQNSPPVQSMPPYDAAQVPDNQINHAFRSIDSQPRQQFVQLQDVAPQDPAGARPPAGAPQTFPAGQAPPSYGSAPQYGAGLADARTAPPSNAVNPLDSMPQWPAAPGNVAPNQGAFANAGTGGPAHAISNAPARNYQDVQHTSFDTTSQEAFAAHPPASGWPAPQGQAPTAAAPATDDYGRRSAAMVGMGAGTGQMFPIIQPSSAGTGSLPPTPQDPAHDRRVNGSQYAAPPQYASAPQMHWNQPASTSATEGDYQAWQHPQSNATGPNAAPHGAGANWPSHDPRTASAPAAHGFPHAPSQDPIAQFEQEVNQRNGLTLEPGQPVTTSRPYQHIGTDTSRNGQLPIPQSPTTSWPESASFYGSAPPAQAGYGSTPSGTAPAAPPWPYGSGQASGQPSNGQPSSGQPGGQWPQVQPAYGSGALPPGPTGGPVYGTTGSNGPQGGSPSPYAAQANSPAGSAAPPSYPPSTAGAGYGAAPNYGYSR